MNGYITAQEAAQKWGVTSRQVQILCKENRVPGAIPDESYLDYSRRCEKTNRN